MRLLIGERHELHSAGIAAFIRANEPDWNPIQCEDLRAVSDSLRDEMFQVLMISGELLRPDELRELRAHHPGLKVIVRLDNPDLSLIHAYFSAGALSCITANSPAAELPRMIRAVAVGDIVIPADLAESLAPPVLADQCPAVPENLLRLTSRQLEVLNLLGEGRSTKEIARSLDLAVGTVKVHLAMIYRSLGAHSRVQAVVKANEILRSGPSSISKEVGNSWSFGSPEVALTRISKWAA